MGEPTQWEPVDWDTERGGGWEPAPHVEPEPVSEWSPPVEEPEHSGEPRAVKRTADEPAERRAVRLACFGVAVTWKVKEVIEGAHEVHVEGSRLARLDGQRET